MRIVNAPARDMGYEVRPATPFRNADAGLILAADVEEKA